jgi:hypothetical protein
MRFAALGLVAAVLGGCATAPVQVTADNTCRVMRTLTWSKLDTPKTVDGIRRHNARYRSVCR